MVYFQSHCFTGMSFIIFVTAIELRIELEQDSIAWSIACLGCKFELQLSYISFMESDHEIPSMATLLLLLSQEGIGETMSTYDHLTP